MMKKGAVPDPTWSERRSQRYHNFTFFEQGVVQDYVGGSNGIKFEFRHHTGNFIGSIETGEGVFKDDGGKYKVRSTLENSTLGQITLYGDDAVQHRNITDAAAEVERERIQELIVRAYFASPM